MEFPEDIQRCRQEIDRLDDEILKILNERSQYVIQIGHLKKQQDSSAHLHTPGREVAIVERLAKVRRADPIILSIPTIGIGAGERRDGQMLVLYDLLGPFDDFVPSFVKPYAHLKADALQAFGRYEEEIECGKFPTDVESYP
jgi:3-methyl-2-oxobutanoate hydroxymethyltransferase